MALPHRLIQVSVLGAFLLGLLIAWRRLTKTDAKNTIVKHPVATPADEVLTYWSADKMRHAQATNMPQADVSEHGKRHPNTPRS